MSGDATAKVDASPSKSLADQLCPFCTSVINDDTRSDDHVFTKALGGHATVPACRTCNSTLGDKVEGQLLRNDTVLNFLRQANGVGGLPTRGVLSDGTAVSHDLRTGEIRPRKPVEVTRSPTSVEYRYSGSRDQVEDLLRKDVRLTPDEVATLLASAVSVPITDPIDTTVVLDVTLATRLAAKAALGAARIAAGPDHTMTPLAAKLRDILWARIEVPVPAVGKKALHALDDTLHARLGDDHEPLGPPPQASQVVFVPRTGERTWIFTWLLGFQLPVLDVETAATFGHLLPVAVRDSKGGAQVISVHDESLTFANKWVVRPESSEHD